MAVAYRTPSADPDVDLEGTSAGPVILRLMEGVSPGGVLAGLVGIGIGKGVEDVPVLGRPKIRIEVQYEREPQLARGRRPKSGLWRRVFSVLRVG
ncbi:hypothetical protein AYO38_08425 [bacterium SCGC AG-212-C10]|nr:hypothetical protein AYO38_08425 [bacterium SCGC AG-212-C10]